VILVKLEERRVEFDLGHKSYSHIEFYLAPIHLALIAYPVLQLASESVWSLIHFNRHCDPNVTWRNVLSSLWC
jgi:hypothetical protein